VRTQRAHRAISLRNADGAPRRAALVDERRG